MMKVATNICHLQCKIWLLSGFRSRSGCRCQVQPLHLCCLHRRSTVGSSLKATKGVTLMLRGLRLHIAAQPTSILSLHTQHPLGQTLLRCPALGGIAARPPQVLKDSRHDLMSARAKGSKSKDTETPPVDGVWIGTNRGQRCEFKACQHCQRPMNRRAKWSDDATWAAVKYCSDKCRKAAKRKPAADAAAAAD